MFSDVTVSDSVQSMNTVEDVVFTNK